ncbi:conserved hypothetical protein [Histoplasma capsulatum H143]|uniref:Uncharacterized protein n=1 Tax=Ajellomyces capsulatus (strain H143) TaxID=544712 RepID=C6HDX4_AJECH|nr:conserved hypothetical protein [Histoplasma capsulatum H143]
MPNPTKSNGTKAPPPSPSRPQTPPDSLNHENLQPVNTPPAQTPPCNPIDESPQQSVTTGDGYQHSDAKELVEALREARADSTTSKSNPSEDTAETVLNNASKLKPQEQVISFSRNPESESPVLMDKYIEFTGSQHMIHRGSLANPKHSCISVLCLYNGKFDVNGQSGRPSGVLSDEMRKIRLG